MQEGEFLFEVSCMTRPFWACPVSLVLFIFEYQSGGQWMECGYNRICVFLQLLR